MALKKSLLGPNRMADEIKKNGKNKVLVVDDEEGISGMLSDVLLEEGYDVKTAPDGETAEKYLSEYAPDLVLLDLSLPEQSGFDVLNTIRKKDEEMGIFIPVIVLTGVYTKRNDKVECLNAGADDFLQKPFDLIELMARVKSLIRLREMYKRSQYLATHDPLTRCHNRRYLMDFLQREMARFDRYKLPFSLVLIDLDRFKDINDQFGHEGGDQVLVHLGYALQDFFRAVDCVGRLGGDEFAVILPDCGLDDAQQVGRRLIRTMSGPFKTQGFPKQVAEKVGMSVGIACVPAHTTNQEELFRMADQALYASKNGGRGQFQIAPILRKAS